MPPDSIIIGTKELYSIAVEGSYITRLEILTWLSFLHILSLELELFIYSVGSKFYFFRGESMHWRAKG